MYDDTLTDRMATKVLSSSPHPRVFVVLEGDILPCVAILNSSSNVEN